MTVHLRALNLKVVFRGKKEIENTSTKQRAQQSDNIIPKTEQSVTSGARRESQILQPTLL